MKSPFDYPHSDAPGGYTHLLPRPVRRQYEVRFCSQCAKFEMQLGFCLILVRWSLSSNREDTPYD